MGIDNWMLAADEALTNLLGEWDIYSTAITGAILIYFTYSVFSRKDPDVHPMLLARQAQPSPVRNYGESPVYRSHSSPHGMELNSGLNVRDPGITKWARGRNGDLRDVWRRIAGGAVDKEGKPTGVKGRIITVLGNETTIEHDLDGLSRQINVIAQHIKSQKGTRVAIYLPNSIELLLTIFACSFYDITPILLPSDQSAETIISMLKQSKADTMVAAAGSIPFDQIVKQYTGLRQLIWVVDEGNKHLDWNEIPKGSGGVVDVWTWQEVVEDQKKASSGLPSLDLETTPKGLVTFWLPKSGGLQMVEYSDTNLVSAISAQLSAIPAAQRISPSDLFFPADSLSNVYTLVVALAAMYYNSSIALNSVASPTSDIVLATQGIAPTIIVASAASLSKARKESIAQLGSTFTGFVHWLQTRTLVQEGVMPVASMLTQFNDNKRPSIGTTPGKLRLVYVSEQAGGKSDPLSAMELSDLRILTGARVVYALTAAKVAGAVTQTSFYDYRVEEGDSRAYSHFGAPLSSVEIILKDTKDLKTTDEKSMGEIFARGPAVVGGEASLGVSGIIKEDNTLSYA